MDAAVSVLLLDLDKRIVLLVLNKEERKILSNEKEFLKPSMWGMPTGRQEPEDEDEVVAAIRETREESGLWAEIDRTLRIEEPAGAYVRIAYVGYPVGGELDASCEEIIDCQWFPIRVLEDPSFQDTKYGKPIYSGHRIRARKLLALMRQRRMRREDASAHNWR